MELGILRSDYMLDVPSGLPLQVEVNTVSTSFMSLSTRVGRVPTYSSPQCEKPPPPAAAAAAFTRHSTTLFQRRISPTYV